MSCLKNKSEISRMAADCLQKNYCYPAVAHCAYYSCFQLMKHIFLFSFGKTEAEFKIYQNQRDEGTHEAMINYFMTYLKNNNKDWRTFNTNITQLRKLRTISDYDNVEIDCLKSNNSVALCDVVLRFLKANIKI